jgi:hypothetical protein
VNIGSIVMTTVRYLLASLAGLLAQVVILLLVLTLFSVEAPDLFGSLFVIWKTLVWLLLNALPVSFVAEQMLSPQFGPLRGSELLKMGCVYYCASFLLCGGWATLVASTRPTSPLGEVLGGFALYALVDALCGLVFWGVLRATRRRWQSS